jgi:hypothetical protein
VRKAAHGEREALLAKPEPDLACRAGLGEALEDRADGPGDRLIGVKAYLAILLSPDQADRQAAPQLAALRLVPDAAVEACPEDVQLSLGHGPLQAQYEAVVERAGMVEAVTVADEGVGDAAEVEQAVPVGVVAGETRDLQPEHEPDLAQRDLGRQAREPGAGSEPGAGDTQILVDHHHLVASPAELDCSRRQRVLAVGGLLVAFHLGGRGLADVDEGAASKVRGGDLGEVSHGRPPRRSSWSWR